MKKKLVTLGLAVASVFMFSTTAFAAGWKQGSAGWWYQNEDGTYPQREWKWIDGNGDGVSECYYFDSIGYCMMNNVTPDGYVVNANGAWTVNGVVQTQVSSKTQTGKNEKLTPEEAWDIIYNYNKEIYTTGHYHISLLADAGDENTAILWECWPTGFKGKYTVDLTTGDCYLEGPYWSPDDPLDGACSTEYWGNLRNL